ncbi:hypothetical protein U3A58_17300 [Algoriphagus sp. C2-6-M1]|uniref:hypothetical protein n=1 Tax=Algoriphagus persicinus TaxID=3108754 RepID=UPI002B3C63F0|nr:hypothetical protein [Algoriphagus sp. C2-6-M1]MEB2782152.1 hypothetical protein [Algoriphagus sp. C2-6-M1]
MMFDESLHSVSDSILGSTKFRKFKGTGELVKGEMSETISFELLCFSSGALICFSTGKFFLGQFEWAYFTGKLEDGHPCTGQIANDFESTNNDVIAFCSTLTIGEINSVLKVSSKMSGVYFPFSIDFEYKGMKIHIKPTKHSKSTARRTQILTGAILEGNEVVIEGNNIVLDEANDFLRKLCILMRPLSCSQVFYRAFIVNDSHLVYLDNYISGEFFGGDYKMLERKCDYLQYFEKGIQKLDLLSEFDLESINDIGNTLAISSSTGLLELKLTSLIVSLERLGSEIAKEQANDKNAWKVLNGEMKSLKLSLKKNFGEYLLKNPTAFNESQKSSIHQSIQKITAWDEIFKRKINNHFLRNNWDVSLDLTELKTIRDELMHTGKLPEEISSEYAFDLSKKLELYLFIHVLDILEIEALVHTNWRGWRKFNDKSKYKLER